MNRRGTRREREVKTTNSRMNFRYEEEESTWRKWQARIYSGSMGLNIPWRETSPFCGEAPRKQEIEMLSLYEF